MIIESSEDLEVVKSFDDLGLREELLRGKNIENHSFKHLLQEYMLMDSTNPQQFNNVQFYQ